MKYVHVEIHKTSIMRRSLWVCTPVLGVGFRFLLHVEDSSAAQSQNAVTAYFSSSSYCLSALRSSSHRRHGGVKRQPGRMWSNTVPLRQHHFSLIALRDSLPQKTRAGDKAAAAGRDGAPRVATWLPLPGFYHLKGQLPICLTVELFCQPHLPWGDERRRFNAGPTLLAQRWSDVFPW